MPEISIDQIASGAEIDNKCATKRTSLAKNAGCHRDLVGIKAFIIHLERSSERETQVKKLIADIPVPTEVLVAIDGEALTQAEVDRVYRPRQHSPIYPFALSKYEIACFLSHRKAWAAVVEQNLEAGFIVEDDVSLDSKFVMAFYVACACRIPGDFIRFPFRTHRERGQVVFAQYGVHVIQPSAVGLGMVAQLVTRDAAIRLLKATETFDRPVDTMVQMSWMTGIAPLSVLHSGVAEISTKLGGSCMKKDNAFFNKLAREFLRPFYRVQVFCFAHLLS